MAWGIREKEEGHRAGFGEAGFYEMEVQMLLSEIWLVLLRHQGAFNQDAESLNPKELARLKTILGFIHENYDKKITLTDIADSVHICKSECCRFFKKHMNESLFDYLLRYRVEQSIPYLRVRSIVSRMRRLVPGLRTRGIIPGCFGNVPGFRRGNPGKTSYLMSNVLSSL